MKDIKDSIPVLETKRLVVTIPTADFCTQKLKYAMENKAHLLPWSPTRGDDHYTEKYWENLLEANVKAFKEGKSACFSIFLRNKEENLIIGNCNFTGIARGPFQACFLGYDLDHRFVGNGYMYESLEAAISYVFKEIGLHKIMANYMPSNERSGNLLRRLNFSVDGYSRDYLFLAGKWQDHILTSLNNSQSMTIE